METLWQDAKYGARMLVKNGGVTVVAVLTLALGIGGNTAIFSVVHALLLRSLPYAQPERLLMLAERNRDGGRMSISYPNLHDWRERAQSYTGMTGFRLTNFNLTGLDQPMRLSGILVNGNFFDLLGVKPALGRTFRAEDDRYGAERSVVLSDSFWREPFGGDVGVLGRTLTLDGELYSIVGVLPADFEFLLPGDFYVPAGVFLRPGSALLDRGNHFSQFAIGRLKPEVTDEQARAEITQIAAQLEKEYPNTNSGNSAMVQPLASVFVEDVRTTVLVLLCAVGFVLLIACVNVANLLLARAAGRQKEMAMRLALGAGRARLVRQVLTESVLLALTGGVAGLVIGQWGLDGLLRMVPPGTVPRLEQIGLDGTVMAFTLGLALLTGLLFGLLPALQASRSELNATLKQGGRLSTGATRHGLRKGLVVAEVGLAVVLLVGAGLMIRTMAHLSRVDLGFRADNLLSMSFLLNAQTYPDQRMRPFYDECLRNVRAVPGVESAALAGSLPVAGSNWGSVYIVGDQPVPERSQLPTAAFNPVTSDYFSTLGIRLRRGRWFTEADREVRPIVAIINETMARKMWPGQDPIGKRLKQGWPENQPPQNPWREVVGVVADVRVDGLTGDTPSQVYLPMAQDLSRGVSLVVRTGGDPLPMRRAIEAAVHTVDKNLPVVGARTMEQWIEQARGNQQVAMTVLGVFAGLGLVLAAVGIYGVFAYTVAQQTPEIGLRMALGARPANILWLVLRQGLVLIASGLAAGLVGSAMLSSLMKALLFRVQPTDPATFAAVAGVLAAVALTACYIPARRGTRVDPMVALRYE